MAREEHAILDRLNQVSGNVYAFATGGNTEQFNDADILFRADKWEHVASDLVPFSAGRAVNWAALRRKADGYTLLAAGRINNGLCKDTVCIMNMLYDTVVGRTPAQAGMYKTLQLTA